MSVEVAVSRLHPDARIPSTAYADDAGLDLASIERVTLAPGGREPTPMRK